MHIDSPFSLLVRPWITLRGDVSCPTFFALFCPAVNKVYDFHNNASLSAGVTANQAAGRPLLARWFQEVPWHLQAALGPGY